LLYLIRIRPKQNFINSQYLNFWINSYRIRLEIEIPLRSTSGVNNINSDEVKRLSVPLPPLPEQIEIVKRIENLFQYADSIERTYRDTYRQLQTLNQSILAKAFRGELVPRDPNDEPASVLLERIKSDRVRQEKPKKTKKQTTQNDPRQLDLLP
jgi:type I restriction enzyme S subunit